MAFNVVRGEGKDGTPAQMTPREIQIKEGGRGRQTSPFTRGRSVLCVP